MTAITDRLTSLWDWLRADARHAAAVVLVVVAAIGAGFVVAAAMQRDTGLGAQVTPSASPSATATAEPMPSATATATVEPTASIEPSADATAAASPNPEPVDGEWAEAEIPGMTYVTHMAERDGRLVALGTDDVNHPGSAMAYSDDGVTWIPVDMSALDLGDVRIEQLGTGEAGFVALGYWYQFGDANVEDVYLFSPDGASWVRADGPDECVSAVGPRWVQGRFVSIGARCAAHIGPPSPAITLTSHDGRAWESSIAEEILLGPWGTDGDRIVMLPGCCGSITNMAISDDAGQTWRVVSDAVPVGVTIYQVAWGHDRWVAEASWLIREGDPDQAACVSADGEDWTCEVVGPSSPEVPEHWSIGTVTATSSGFVSFRFGFDDQFAPSGTTVILGTSADGMTWTFAPVERMKDAFTPGTLASSHGLFAWGEVRRLDGSVQPFLLIHAAPLP